MVTQAEENAYINQEEKKLKSHREIPSGRDYRCFKERGRADMGNDFEKRFDNTFPDAPGSDDWFRKKFKGKAKRKGIKIGYHSGGFLG
jgi:hypothetical protein